jgi:hypothetical protein
MKRFIGKLAAKSRADVMVIAWFGSPECWEAVRGVSVDADEFHDSYAEWLSWAEEVVRSAEAEGNLVSKAQVDSQELLSWCESEDRPVDAEARSEYAGLKAYGSLAIGRYVQ